MPFCLLQDPLQMGIPGYTAWRMMIEDSKLNIR